MTMSRIAKEIIDRALSLLAIGVLSPLFLVIAVAVKLDSRGPVFFTQIREGWRGAPFTIYKFRTMIAGAERMGLDIERSDPRITRVGKWLRMTSIDELPQLLNVLLGQMSFVGPRPLLPGTTRPHEARRQNVKPGLTSYPVLFGRHKLDWEERMPLDLWYVDHWSLRLDIYIVLRTIPVVLSGHGVYDNDGGSRSRNQRVETPTLTGQ